MTKFVGRTVGFRDRELSMKTLNRRDAIKVVVGASAALYTGCTRGEPPMTKLAEVQGLVPLPAGAAPWPTRDPFLFCVHHLDLYPKGNAECGPQASLAGRQLGQDFAGIDGWRMYHGATVPGFPSHPHRGFETVTVVRQGLLDHADSMGAAARYGEGDVQWLTAGAGIQHAEMFPLLRQDADNPVELFQIWLNLPSKDKFAKPHFSMFWNDEVPTLVNEQPGVEMTLVAGRLGEAVPPKPPPESWASASESDVAIWTVKLQADARLVLPPASDETLRSLYFFEGQSLGIAGQSIGVGNRIDVDGSGTLEVVNGASPAQLLVLQGKPIGEPIVQHGPFVMNSADEIRQAIMDYQQTQFGGWPWKRRDPVHGTERKRFAQFVDGRREEPNAG